MARAYHEAALTCFAGMLASRSNYDVAEGRDATGRQCVGVLEQSWRLGGASGAEVAALEAPERRPRAADGARIDDRVHGARRSGSRGSDACISPASTIISGRITKYAKVHRDGRS